MKKPELATYILPVSSIDEKDKASCFLCDVYTRGFHITSKYIYTSIIRFMNDTV